MRRLLLLFIAFADAAMPSLTRADPLGQATLNAVAFESFPDGQPLDVRVLDNSEENLRIAREAERAFTERGFSITEDQGALVLTIETGDIAGALSTRRDTEAVEMRDDRGRLSPGGELAVTRQVQYPFPKTNVVTPAQYRIGFTIDDGATGDRIWQGWVIADLGSGEPAEFARAMLPKLADSIGRTVREEVFTLE